MKTNVIYNEDCLGENGVQRLPSGSVDMVLADLPYGTTENSWDSVIPLDKLWKQYKRIIKQDGAIVLTSAGKFTPKLKASNLEWFKYEWIWQKDRPTGWLNANRRPMRIHENVLVFYKNQPTFNPQKTKGHEPVNTKGEKKGKTTSNYGDFTYQIKGGQTDRYPQSIVKFNVVNSQKGQGFSHPTQKPVDLFKYLIKTYTSKGDVVLDNVIGSGTTAVACKALDRKYIGFEKDEEYHEIAQERVSEVQKELI